MPLTVSVGLMQPRHLSWLINGGTYAAAVAVVSALLSLPLPFALLLLSLPLSLPWLYSASSFAPSPHAAHFRRLLIAHRGGRFRAAAAKGGDARGSQGPLGRPAAAVHPENSLEAFRVASEQPLVSAVELDVWLSADRQPVVLHDGFLHRTFDGHTHHPHLPSPHRVRQHSTAPMPSPHTPPDGRLIAAALRPLRRSLSVDYPGKGHVRALTVQQLQALTYRTADSQPTALSDDDEDDTDVVEQQQSPSSPSSSTSPTPPLPSPPPPPPRLPTLAEVVKLIRPTHLKLMIEVKEVHAPGRMAAALHELFAGDAELYRRCFVASFLPQALLCVRRTDPLICTALLGHPHLSHLLVHQLHLLGFPVSPWLEHSWAVRALLDGVGRALLLPSVVRWLGCSLVCVHVSAVSAAMLRAYRRAGLDVCAWTVNNRAQRAWLQQAGVGCITDYPFEELQRP